MKSHSLILLSIAAAAMTLGQGCGSSGQQKGSATDAGAVDSISSVRKLPVPEVPDELDTPELRLRYVLNHFWDGLDFTDHSLSLDTAFMEQNFSNFISFFQYEPNALPPFTHLIENAEADPTATIYLWDVAEKYLDDPNSPMRNGELYRIFLTALKESKALGKDLAGKVAYQLKIADLNRPGMRASDFRYMSRAGERKTLLQQASGKMTLLIFYDPDCESCKKTLADLMNQELPEQLNVIAIDAESDRDRWMETKDGMPAGWEIGFALDDIQGNLVYHLPAMPTLYLLDSNGRILLKDPPVSVALSTIAQLPTGI